MKKALVLGLSMFAFTAMAETLTGYVVDSNCATKQGAKAASEKHAGCAEKCIKGGAAAVLVQEDGKIYKVADQGKVTPHAGHKVTVTGKIDGDTIKDITDVKM